MPGGRRLALTFRVAGDAIPAVLQLPEAHGPAPAALLLHGYSSRKEHMAESAGAALLQHGIASLAIDLPMHGDRGSADRSAASNPLGVMRSWQAALEEGSLSLRYLAARPEVDRARLGVIGYSLGAYLGLAVAAREQSVRAIILAAGGDLPGNTPFAAVVRAFVDPLSAIRRIAGRPLLMVHGRSDRTISPEQAERLFAAAAEPKELQWWNAGHYLPADAIYAAAAWLRVQFDGMDRRAESG